MKIELKAYCINLPSEEGRRQHCQSEYEKAEIDFEFIPAVDGRVEDVRRDEPQGKAQADWWSKIDQTAMSLAFFNRGTNSPERACALSHYNVWELISKVDEVRADEYFMVNEDDFNVITTKGLAEALNELKSLKLDMVYLGHRGGEYKPPTVHRLLQKIWHQCTWIVSRKTETKRFRRNLVLHGTTEALKGSEFFYRAGMTWGGHAYLLNKSGAQKLMRFNENLRFLPDEAFRYAILDGDFEVGMSKVKYFGCETDFGSALRSQEDHDAHHQLFPST